ncbi:hypothetical protein [Aliiroseovarius sp. 2305UL8-7]|uniref:hypothetical protein n=1 Tax=Aliiroseovarius conchicola TaxID=3121637 RepID=UPI003527BDBF
MYRSIAPFAIMVSIALSGCQSTGNSETSRGSATFCDRLIRWTPIEGEDGAERAVTQAEVCAKPAGDGVWIKVSQVHSKRRGRAYWLLLPANDAHLAVTTAGQKPSLSGWVLQARPFSWAHEIVAVRTGSAASEKPSGGGTLVGTACPRKAVGKSPEQRYCIATR